MNDTASALPARPVAPRLLASWRRSRRYGVPEDELRPVFTGAVDTGSLLYECGLEVLRGLQEALAGEPVSMMITDADGLVLSRLCHDAGFARSLDRVHLAPGFFFAERDAGTNGLGLALADRAPSLVRADEHYCTGLRGYTCAAVPVLDPLTGDLAGSVNLTTWSDTASGLLLALAKAAAGNTSALMLARSGGRRARPVPRGEVTRFGGGDRVPLSPAWEEAVEQCRDAQERGLVVAVVGEQGSGRAALAALARRTLRPRDRLLVARPPSVDDVDSWLALWSPELGKDSTCVVVSGVDRLPAWAAAELAQRCADARTGGPQPFVLTADRCDTLDEPLAALVDTVVEAPPLRGRPADVLALAGHFSRRDRGRDVAFTPAARRALTAFDWPGNAKQLRAVVREASARTDLIDVRHLPAEVLSGSARGLSRLQVLERDEIVRCLTAPGATVVSAAAALEMGRATLYRKIAQYDIRLPGRSTGSTADPG
ncbi:Bacterial regulatory protein, Fis family [Actinosynnema pretiosum]|nr:Bacterial regulatory protein, Fis family [Actinosynnema pretiosum]